MTTEVGAAVAEPVAYRLPLADGQVHVLRAGAGPPLLFLHAAGGAGGWFPFHDLLARRFEVFAPDHPGFGKSDDFPAVEAMDDLVYHYLDVIDALGLDRPHVVGASFGGWLAAELAVAAPSAIGSLALLSPVGLRMAGEPVADLFLMTPRQVVDALFRDRTRAGALFPGPPDVDAVIAAYRDRTALARFCWVPFMANPKLERRLHRITAPTLVAWPEDDRVVPGAHAHRYAQRIPGARLHTVPDCGHAMYFERPAEFAGIVTGFLAPGTEPDGAPR
jgi:pimeloyl-ACP methyl ester carboxylesterase